MIIGVFISEIKFINRLKYVLIFLTNHPFSGGKYVWKLNPKEYDLSIEYSITNSGKYHYWSCKQDCLFDQKDTKFDFTSIEDDEVFGIGIQEESSEKSLFKFDFFETIFFHVSRYEEYVSLDQNDHDQHGRMKAEKQFLVKNELNEVPVIDRLVEKTYQRLGLKTTRMLSKLSMSHDIDLFTKYKSAYRWIWSSFACIYHGYGFSAFWKSLLYPFTRKKDPYQNFDWLLVEGDFEKYIYWMAGGKTGYDNHYSIHDPRVKNTIIQARKRGYKQGIHPSYASSDDTKQWEKELSELETVLGEKVQFSRQHFLKFDIQTTAHIVEKNGIKDESSLGYTDRIGFKSGTGYKYSLYNFRDEKAFNFITYPLVVMDVSLLRMCDFNMIKTRNKLISFLENNKFNTAINFNFHNSSFDPILPYGLEFRKIYELLIKSYF